MEKKLVFLLSHPLQFSVLFPSLEAATPIISIVLGVPELLGIWRWSNKGKSCTALTEGRWWCSPARSFEGFALTMRLLTECCHWVSAPKNEPFQLSASKPSISQGPDLPCNASIKPLASKLNLLCPSVVPSSPRAKPDPFSSSFLYFLRGMHPVEVPSCSGDVLVVKCQPMEQLHQVLRTLSSLNLGVSGDEASTTSCSRQHTVNIS